MFRALSVCALVLLAACDAPAVPSASSPQSSASPSAARNPYASYSTTQLWGIQGMTTSASELRLAEAELGTRGQTSFGSWYIGQRTASEVGTARYSRGGGGSGGRDCNSFASSAEAQRYFLLNGGPSNDPHNLDGDGDGYACEWGTSVRSYYSTYKPKATVYSPARAYSSSRCYRGPRGGTYTITASGNKNYGGC
ncbi:MAG: excalibur calcium-binding domain-containing protein [Tabrizicola sp.]|nr:excalibur calcium-binding domain-containing protein [Tabrizicola sp.]